MTATFYTLDDNLNPVLLQQPWEQGNTLPADRARSHIDTHFQGYRISTIFLGVDLNFSCSTLKAPPLLFETMVFHTDNQGQDIYCQRSHTFPESVEAHSRALEWLMAHVNKTERTQ